MAVLPRVLDRGVIARRTRREISVTFDNSYATGGEPFTERDCELSAITSIHFSHATLAGAYTGHNVRWDSVNKKLLVYTIVGVEIAGAVDLSTFVATLIVEGRR